jgi:hypothetical protein
MREAAARRHPARQSAPRWESRVSPPAAARAGNAAATSASKLNRFDALVAASATREATNGTGDRGLNGSKPTPSYPITLDDVTTRFRERMHLPDEIPLYAVFGTVAANYLPGDPVWLGLIAPSSSSKTELLNAVTKMPNVKEAATLTAAALLSGTSRKERAKNASGGLLKEIGEFGILIAKDFTSILSDNKDTQAEVLAAFREIYDGRWTRHVGTDGGQSLSWEGKMGFLFGATPAYDSRHALVGAMGERFLLCRLASGGPDQALAALERTNRNAMRRELAECVASFFAQPRSEPPALDKDEKLRLVTLASLTVRMRSVVERDRHTREIEAVHGKEGPARLALALNGLLDGLASIGCERQDAWRVIERVAGDSVPPLRRQAFDTVRANNGPMDTKAVALKLDLPTTTVRRALEDLAAYQLVARDSDGAGHADTWSMGDVD